MGRHLDRVIRQIVHPIPSPATHRQPNQVIPVRRSACQVCPGPVHRRVIRRRAIRNQATPIRRALHLPLTQVNQPAHHPSAARNHPHPRVSRPPANLQHRNPASPNQARRQVNHAVSQARRVCLPTVGTRQRAAKASLNRVSLNRNPSRNRNQHRSQPVSREAILKANQASTAVRTRKATQQVRQHLIRIVPPPAEAKVYQRQAADRTQAVTQAQAAKVIHYPAADRLPIHNQRAHRILVLIPEVMTPPACPFHQVVRVPIQHLGRRASQDRKAPTAIVPAIVKIRASAIHLAATAINHPKATTRHPTQIHPAKDLIVLAKVHPIVATAPIGRARAIQPRSHPKTAAVRVNRATALGFGRVAGN